MKISIIEAKNPKWVNEEKTIISLDIIFEHLQNEGYVPFNATANDIYEHTVNIFNRTVAGEFGKIGDYVPKTDSAFASGVIPVTNTGN